MDYEKIIALGGLEFLAKQVVEGFITGLHKSPFHGFSVEFSEHRLYNPGESVKDIDWKLFARTDKLFVKQYEEETNLRCQLVIDGSSSMFFPKKEFNKFQHSVFASAALIHLLRQQRDAFGLSIIDQKIQQHLSAKSSRAQQKILMSKLEEQILNPPQLTTSNFIQKLHDLAELLPKRSLVVLFSDFLEGLSLDEIQSAWQHLRFKKHEVIIFQVLEEKHEFEFDYSDRPHVFVDLESGEKFKMQPKEFEQSFKDLTATRRKQLEEIALGLKIDFVNFDINQGFDTVLMAYLNKRTKMLR
jgi:uncharacterized protein (DUF58 family)